MLLKSKDEIAKDFKELNPSCDFSITTLVREFPQNAVTPITCDQQRNTCPVHANIRRLIKAINKRSQHASFDRLPISTRDLIYKLICQSSTSQASAPLTWNKLCVEGACKSCPKTLAIDIPQEDKNKTVKFLQWEQRKTTFQKETEGKIVIIEKSAFDLYTEVYTLEKAMAFLEEKIP